MTRMAAKEVAHCNMLMDRKSTSRYRAGLLSKGPAAIAVQALPALGKRRRRAFEQHDRQAHDHERRRRQHPGPIEREVRGHRQLRRPVELEGVRHVAYL